MFQFFVFIVVVLLYTISYLSLTSFFYFIYIYIYIIFYVDVFQLYEIMRINYSFELDPGIESMLSRLYFVWSLMWDPLPIIDLLRKW